VLFGKAAWWLPAWLDKILPHISVEGETMPGEDEASPDVSEGGPRHAAPGAETV
jgi:RND superfamily putative drug exporter